MSDIVQDDVDDASVDAILPLEETMSDCGRNSEDGISAGTSIGNVGKPAGNNVGNNRSDISSANADIGGDLPNTSVGVGKGKLKASNASRISGVSESSIERKAMKMPTASFSQEDAELLEELTQIPLERLTGRQQEALHGVFYRKHAEKNKRYMLKAELVIHTYFESLPEEEDLLEHPARSKTPGLGESSSSEGFTPIYQPQQHELKARQVVEPIRFGLEEPVSTTRYVPTTRDVLDMDDKI